MASEKIFAAVPPFPDDLPVAPMPVIPLSSLSSGKEAIGKTLLDACKEFGFFLLDLRGDTVGEMIQEEIDSLFVLSKKIMELPEDVKRKYAHNFPKNLLG